ncbi:precorrin-6y C5,15-methyltransferase (decarboxylating) subunit CbiE [Fulvimarina sp. 2208YS6-2-32]|uniref:Precorrin-6y C5,15-methyltransferase (Decarboxylating) subunit CbiE n=1 Tax=Fulvimarina uroteuthidis TaxID=3098149 RepID=A0ABU5I1U8_9HYPH|nr:precorrin-6y C5,15-methyltransferase (decarboxylating) subunit CbiE [Fulvimarina sp. 2208YS6-2-32]MDY8109349.1 precorrin-6y C5,15-methyltransferase (decarboxylating) subunit CbiE [Fulvimarina sp. 2208YS6-2-32]
MTARDAWLTVIGIGEDGLSALSDDAHMAIAEADAIFGGARHLEMLGQTRSEQFAWGSPFERNLAAIEALEGENVVVLATGDPLWFGVGATLARRFGESAVRVIPSLSAFQLVAARLAWALQDCECLTAHGRPIETLVRFAAPGARLIVLTSGEDAPRDIARLLTARGYGQSRLVVCENLGGYDERVRTALAADFDLDDIDPLNTVAIECRAGLAATPRPSVPGLPDDAFVHDGKMTKRVMRSLAIAALAPIPGDLLWDVGAGSGSIGIEWLRASPRLSAIAIEPREDRCAMIAENALALGTPDLTIVRAKAADAFADLPAPDAVFIGGGLTDGVHATCWQRLKPGGRLVAHAVTLESESILIDLHAQLGGELLRIGVETVEKVGPYRGFKPSMTVIHWHVTKPRHR